IRIPSNAPTQATDPNVPSQIKVVTAHGQAIFAFTLDAPAPIILSMSNENALAGETVTITGSNFYLVNQVIFPGNIAVTNFTVTPDGTQITATVPTGVTTGAPLKVAAKFGTGSSKFLFDNFLAPSTGFLANFEWGDPYFGWAYWGGINTNDGTLFPQNTGQYIEVHPSGTINAGDGGWYADNRAVNLSPSAWTSNMSDPISSYALEFEMRVNTSWKNGSFMITTSAEISPPSNTNWAYLARFAPWQNSPTGDAKTNGWVTVSIPLTAFLSTNNGSYNASGTTAPNFKALMGGTTSVIQIMLYNDSSTPMPVLDAAFDNVRIVKVR
ncbi:MAG TPA: glycan-binding surface protein, partial [Puia sp.]|nr:glycan-binding surface protein [Puia sp.]